MIDRSNPVGSGNTRFQGEVKKNKSQDVREKRQQRRLCLHTIDLSRKTPEETIHLPNGIKKKLKVQEWPTYCKMNGYVANERQTGEDKY